MLDDAADLAKVVKQVERESPFMLYESGERDISTEKQLQMIHHLVNKHNSNIFVTIQDGHIVGYLFAIGGSTNKTKHCAHIVIGVIEAYRGKGIGSSLFRELEKWAKGKLHRLELTVITENNAGINLYEKAGFIIEGVKKHSLYMDNRFVDEYYMGKLLEG